MKKKQAKAVKHPVLGDTVTIEMRTGSGTTVRVVPRSSGTFSHIPGAMTQCGVVCSPQIRVMLEAFYAKVDADLADWELKRDYELGCPYAVKRVKAMRRHALALKRMSRLAGKGRVRT